MKPIAIAASAVAILVGAYSFVYACNESHSTQAAKAPKAVAEYTVIAGETAAPVARVIDDKAWVCKTVQSVAPIAIAVDIPGEAFQMTRVIHIRGAAVNPSEIAATPVQTVMRTAKFAATLGRAFVTTVGAVFGSLVDVAVHATASWV